MVAMMTATTGRPMRWRSTAHSTSSPTSTMTTMAREGGDHDVEVEREDEERDDVAREHHELALREVDDLGSLVDEHGIRGRPIEYRDPTSSPFSMSST